MVTVGSPPELSNVDSLHFPLYSGTIPSRQNSDTEIVELARQSRTVKCDLCPDLVVVAKGSSEQDLGS